MFGIRIAASVEVAIGESVDRKEMAVLVTPCVHVVESAKHWPDQRTSGRPFRHVKSLDAKLFDAYNNCNLAVLSSMVSDDLEFYHDQTGLSVGKHHSSPQTSRTFAGKCNGH